MAKTDMKERVLKLMQDKKHIRNMATCAHIDHGKTTLADTLVAGAGMLSDRLAGQARFLDDDEEEQQRGITIDSADISMVHEHDGKEYLINLIDTPGHVDFGGNVTRAMRAVDGALVLICAVEGVMPQTETVLRQALRERVKPILFINKVDRLIKELKLSPDEMQKRFLDQIAEVNRLIYKIAPEEYKKEWQVSIQDGSVGFGTAVHRWAINMPIMKKTGLNFSDILDAYKTEDGWHVLEEKAPLHEVLLDMVVKHLPDPDQAQKYRIPRLWRGDLESNAGKSLLSCDPSGPVIACVTKVVNDPHAGQVASARMFSGTIKMGDTMNLINARSKARVPQIAIYKGPTRISAEEVPAGNIIAIVGMKDLRAGETITSIEGLDPFEAIKHIFEPVVTKAVEAKNARDLPKLVEALISISREDPTVKVEINQETGEHLVSGMGELHLEIWQHRLERDFKVPVNTSPPIVVFRETVAGQGGPEEGKSPNKHNRFFLKVEPLPDELYEALKQGDIPEMRLRKGKDERVREDLIKLGLSKDEAKKALSIFNDCILIDATKGIVALHEVIETVIDGFEEIMKNGPLAFEKCAKMKVSLMDAKLHEDSIHRGPAQVIPAVRESIKASMLAGGALLLEPIQTIRIDVPQEMMGSATGLVQSRRGKVADIQTERGSVVVVAEMPVDNMFGFTSDLRSATNGHGFWSLMESNFEPMPRELQREKILSIRKRKGMKEELPPTTYLK